MRSVPSLDGWRPVVGPGLLLLGVVLAVGCDRGSSEPPIPTGLGSIPKAHQAAPDLDAVQTRAIAEDRLVLLLITEPGATPADDTVAGILDNAQLGESASRVIPVVLDLSVSRNRATAGRFRAVSTPILLCLSPHGLIVSRDEGSIDAPSIRRRLDEAAARSPQLEAKFAEFDKAVKMDPANLEARVTIADFLERLGNHREAIPHLSRVAHAERADPAQRVRAWVDLARAHLDVTEPEKARREAQSLIATLGDTYPEARAGGLLVQGLQDARAKRNARARQEFADAVAAAPDSAFATQAREAAERLPSEGP